MTTPTVTSPREWNKTSKGHELTLPSGNVCLVKRPGMEKIFQSGAIPDELASIAMETITKHSKTPTKPQDRKKKGNDEVEGLSPEDLQKMFKRPEDIWEMIGAFDRIAVMCVEEPKLLWHKREVRNDAGVLQKDDDNKVITEEIPPEERDEDVLYSDDIDLEDKVFIFNYAVGGSSDLEQFRQEYGDGLDALSSGEVVDDEAEPTAESG